MAADGIVTGDGSGGTLLPDPDTQVSEEKFEEAMGDLLALMIFSDLIMDDITEDA